MLIVQSEMLGIRRADLFEIFRRNQMAFALVQQLSQGIMCVQCEGLALKNLAPKRYSQFEVFLPRCQPRAQASQFRLRNPSFRSFKVSFRLGILAIGGFHLRAEQANLTIIGTQLQRGGEDFVRFLVMPNMIERLTQRDRWEGRAVTVSLETRAMKIQSFVAPIQVPSNNIIVFGGSFALIVKTGSELV